LRSLRILLPIAVCAAVLVPGAPATATAPTASAPAMVSVVHGVRGLVADVRVDGKLVLTNTEGAIRGLKGGSPRLADSQAWRDAKTSAGAPLLIEVTSDALPAKLNVTLAFGCFF